MFSKLVKIVKINFIENELNVSYLYSPPVVTCSADQFTCVEGGACIDKRRVCDDRADCRDRSDEANCGKY